MQHSIKIPYKKDVQVFPNLKISVGFSIFFLSYKPRPNNYKK